MSHTQNGAEVILELLRSNGIDCVFASPIATMAPCGRRWLRGGSGASRRRPATSSAGTRSLAVAAASGYYKATGRAQAVFLPTGLGVLHGAMALRTALQERTPMTVLSPDTLTYGEVPSLDPGPEWPSLLVDLVGPARDGELCVKWAKEAKTPGDLVHELRRALYFAEAIPKGPTLVSVPFDLLMSPMPFERAAEDRAAAGAGATGSNSTRSPPCSPGARSRSSSPSTAVALKREAAALIGLAEALAAPVFEFIMPAYHNAPRAHPLVMPGPVEPVLERADAIVVAGANAPWHPPSSPRSDRGARWSTRGGSAATAVRLLGVPDDPRGGGRSRAQPPRAPRAAAPPAPGATARPRGPDGRRGASGSGPGREGR